MRSRHWLMCRSRFDTSSTVVSQSSDQSQRKRIPVNDVRENPKKRTTTQDRIVWPFAVIVAALMIMAPVWTIMRNPYAEYAMPAAIIVLVVMFVIILFYNKIRLGVWLRGVRKIQNKLYGSRRDLCRSSRANHGLATCQTLFTPSPVASPGFLSLVQV